MQQLSTIKQQLNDLDWRWLAGGGAALGLMAGATTLLALDSRWESPWLLLLWDSMLAGLAWLGWDAEPRLAHPLVTPQTARPVRPKLIRDGPFEMVDLPGRDFIMGSPDTDEMAQGNEKPQHRVRVSGFRICRTPVTVGLYQEVMERSEDTSRSGDLSATDLSWEDAVTFCNRLSKREGLRPCYRKRWYSRVRFVIIDRIPRLRIEKWLCDWTADGYRLPTETEWEYACRAGTETRYGFGDDPARLGDFAWFKENASSTAQPVARKRPNRWGLYDMHGNVWEWCWDWYGPSNTAEQSDPRGPTRGGGRVLRGGSFFDSPENLRSALRVGFRPVVRGQYVGFRCVRVASPQH